MTSVEDKLAVLTDNKFKILGHEIGPFLKKCLYIQLMLFTLKTDKPPRGLYD